MSKYESVGCYFYSIEGLLGIELEIKMPYQTKEIAHNKQ
jgi:hypothetical protein